MYRAVAGTVAANLVIQSLNLISGVLLARFLGPHGRGELATAMLWPGLVANVAIMGADVALGRKTVEKMADIPALYRLALVITAILGSAFVILGVTSLPVVIAQDKKYLLPEAITLLAGIPFGILNVLLATIELSAGCYKAYNTIRIIYALLYALTLTIAFVVLGPSLDVVVGCIVFVSIASPLPFLFTRLRRGAIVKAETETSLLSRAIHVLRTAAPFGVAALLGHVASQLPVMLLTYFASTTAIGLFVVAMTAANLHLSFGAAWSKVLFAQALARGDSQMSEWFVRKFHQSVLAYVFISAAMMLCVPLLIPLIFGRGFADAGTLTFWLIPITAITATGLALDEALRARGVSRATSVSKTLGSFVMVTVAFIALPLLALSGLVVALGAAAVTEFSVYIFFCTRVYGVRPSDLMRIDRRVLASSVRGVLNDFRRKS